MEKYRYSDAEFRLIENSCMSFAIYQFIEHRVVTIALSEGFLELFHFDDRAAAYDLMDNDMYRDVWPEDVARMADLAVRFATEGGEYNTLYRVKIGGSYRMIRARGKHIYPESGVRLAVIWYSDEGNYDADSEKQFKKNLDEELQEYTRNLRGNYDPLTGLPGMNYFFELAEAGRKAIQEKGGEPVALYFDFNGMKKFNLKYGFAEGDKLIQAMSKVLIRHFSNENCCRFGGDRFAAYTENVNLEERLNKVLEDCRVINDGKNLPVRIGIYVGSSDAAARGIGIGIACDRAKMACDINRDNPAAGFSYFSDDMLKETERQQYIIDNLDRAIRENWIQVYYQPIIRAANGRVCDEEALARWIDPVKGFMSPADFIPVLENAGLIYKLDLYITEQILLKMEKLKEAGLYLVPSSVNISRSDFEACDIVEEIRKRVDASGIGRDMLTIEITESIIGNDLSYIKKQVDRFHELGFSVWMDDYGSGYSSPDILQSIPFDTIKLDMQFIRQYETNKSSRIIVSGLVKMAVSLGIETVVEGVETAEQVEFLKEIGCTKLQGYYFCKPIPLSEVLRRYETGAQIGFENPAETDYYAAIGRVNLYDISLASSDDEGLQDYFNTMPMAIFELDDEGICITRTNQSYRTYIKSHRSIPQTNTLGKTEDLLKTKAAPLLKKVMQCAKDGRQILSDEKSGDGKINHLLVRRIAVNPVSGKTALLIIVLGVTDEKVVDEALTYAHVAQALSADYIDLYYVNMDTERFMEYKPDPLGEEMAVEKRGKNFFSAARSDAAKYLYEEDREMFISNFTKENVADAIADHGAYTITYRTAGENGPVYVSMKAIRIGTEGNRIVIGVNNVDAQMKHKEAIERIKEERITYSRIMALVGDYICFYTVDPDTDAYVEYSATKAFEKLGVSEKGDDFYADTMAELDRVVYPEDVEQFREEFTKQKILEKVRNGEVFSLNYRIIIDGEPRYVCLKAALVNEDGTERMIIGINDIDAQIRRDQEYAHNLAAARNRANIDPLTGVKNKRAYADMEGQLDQFIIDHSAPKFSVAVFELRFPEGLSVTKSARDELIREGCLEICRIFRHSPVYRMDEEVFSVISRGEDYENIDTLMEDLRRLNTERRSSGRPVIAGGLVRFQGDNGVAEVYGRAEEAMKKDDI